MKTRTKKRMLSILLSALMCIWLIQPVPLWAAAAGDPSDDVAVSLPTAPNLTMRQMFCSFWTVKASPRPADSPPKTIM